jgi:hypothetical protein
VLTLERVRTEFLSLPFLTRIGLLILVLGGLADVVAHLAAAGHAEHVHEHTASELSAHLIGFVGMVAILLGIVLDGACRTRRGRSVVRRSEGPVVHRPRGRDGSRSALVASLFRVSWLPDACSRPGPRGRPRADVFPD